MSDKKRIIKVDDLVIYADNVTVEPRRPDRDRDDHDRPHRERPLFDPFLGPRRQEVEEEVHEEAEETEEGDDRPPFSWI